MARSQSSREPITFQKLLVEARAGSAEALGKILISFTTELHRRAESFVHPPSLQAKGNSADLVQTTFVEAQRNLKHLRRNKPSLKATLIVLGSGTSMGVPTIGCDCTVCTSDDIHDRRTRPSVLVQYGGRNVLIGNYARMPVDMEILSRLTM